ncbi:MAG: XkdF-like putative serine protease domain-containing protein [Loktanella sp.]|nr:XkdF-like putative serine protease domain-containing protein [Loktanella sp.]
MFDTDWDTRDDWGAEAAPADPVPAATEPVADIAIKKADDEEQIVYGEVYAPGMPDSQGDYMTAGGIREMAYGFMRKGITSNIDVQHTQQPTGSYIVESFIARDGDPVFIPDSWVIGVKIPDPALWGLVKSGELNGFSLDGYGARIPGTIEYELPDIVKGETDEVADHSHDFSVRFSDEGEFLGGQTGPGPDGHVHRIQRGTVTEETNGHKHRFSFVEGVLNAQG